MPAPTPLTDAETEQLRSKHYNAILSELIVVHEDLRILRVIPDDGMPGFEPGQYTVLGLGYWEPRFEQIPDEPHDEAELRKLCRRAYSMSCPMIKKTGELWPPSECPFLEFYVVLIREADDHAPALTPRLFALSEGDRLFVGPKSTGHYTLSAVNANDDCIFIATGTGEAPNNAMAAQLLHSGHRGRIVSITCARMMRDLGYLSTHRRLQQQFANYRYHMLTTRESVNLDPNAVGYVGKRYLQEYFDSGDFEREMEIELDPARSHVFLCGNPLMIGAPIRQKDGTMTFPEERGMVEILERRGYRADAPKNPGNVHFEKYW